MAKYSIIYLIDTPPISLYSDAIVVGQAANGIAMVITEQETGEESVRHAVQELAKASGGCWAPF